MLEAISEDSWFEDSVYALSIWESRIFNKWNAHSSNHLNEHKVHILNQQTLRSKVIYYPKKDVILKQLNQISIW